MATQVDVEELKKALVKKGVPAEDVNEAVRQSTFSKRVYETAVIFLGIVTILLALGGIAQICFEKQASEALWTALGAGIGGLAGIFTGKSNA